ncbi:MAG: hypothetical protein OEX08_01860 [Candidatus Nomurabacteria bacterium]|nr:hypothetical protein [Candidatus Nomurabacteria bacterium]
MENLNFEKSKSIKSYESIDGEFDFERYSLENKTSFAIEGAAQEIADKFNAEYSQEILSVNKNTENPPHEQWEVIPKQKEEKAA